MPKQLTNLGGRIAGGTAIALVAAVPGFAQTTGGADAKEDAQTSDDRQSVTTGLDIIVTASKREERLADVGSAITAISGDALEYRNLRNVQDISAQVPGLSLQTGGVRSVRVILRGLNTGGNGATTAIVVDETPLSYQSGLANGATDTANIDTFDLARVEVLKGPQGTLYGATAQGGLVRYVTNAPDSTRLEARAEIGSEVNEQGGLGYVGRGMINVPIVEDLLAVRATGYYEEVAGFIDNPLLGISNANRGERWGGRVSILFTPTERMSFRATGVRQVQEFDDSGTLELVGAATSLNNPPANQFDVANNGRPALSSFLGNPSRNVYEYVNLTADFDLGFGDFVSSTSLGRLSTEFRGDISFGLLAPGLTISDALSLGVYGERVAAWQVQTNASDRVNQELRLSSKPDSQLFGIRADWQAGFFYAREEIQFDQSFDVISVETGNLLTAPLPGGGTEAPAEYEEYSGFANTTIYFSDNLDLHLGGRYTDNTQRSQIFSLFGFVNPGGDRVSVPIESSETEFTYSTALRWRFNSDSLLYGRIATGFRPGGPNFAVSTLPPNVPATYQADTTTNYEVGLRTALLDRSVTIDVAAFYIDWNDIQVATTFNADGINTTVIANGGAARSQGLEWNFGWSPAAGLRLSAVGAYTDATLTEDAPALGGNAGDRLPFVPKWSNTVNLDYDTEVKPGVTGYAGLSWVYVGERFTSFSSTPAFPGYFELPSYNMVHMQAGLTFDHFDVSLYVRNIGNSQAPTGYVPQGGFGGTGSGNIVQPRTIGLRAGVRF